MADTKVSALATEAAPSVGNERIHMVVNLSGTPADRYINIGDIVMHSDSAPSTPEDGYLWFETDTGILWVYGTYAAASRWVSVQIFSKTWVINAVTGNNWDPGAGSGSMNPINGYDWYLDTFYAHYRVATTSSGSHYYTLLLRKVSGTTLWALDAGSAIGSGIVTSGATANTWTEGTETLNTTIDRTSTGSLEVPFFQYKTTAGAPGAISAILAVNFRLIHP